MCRRVLVAINLLQESSAQVLGSVTFDTGVSRNERPEIGPDERVQLVEIDQVPIAVENNEKHAYLGLYQPSAVDQTILPQIDSAE